MTLLKRILSIVALLALAACGGGGGSPGSNPNDDDDGGGGTPVVVASDIVLVLSSETIANSGTVTVTATATALDANRNALPGATLTLSANNDAVVTLTSSTGVSDDAGRVQATIGIGSNRTNRVITVSAVSGSVTRTAELAVVTSPGSATPTSIELIASSTTVGTGGNQVTLQAFVKDATNNALAGAPITFSSNTGTLSGASTETNTSGAATVNFAAGSDRSNRSATITASSGTIQAQLTLPITGTKLTASGPTSLIIGGQASYTVQVVDSNNNVLPNVAVTASSSLGNGLVASGNTSTDSNGQVFYNYTATASGADRLSFSAANFTAPDLNVAVSGDDFQFVSPAAATLVPVGQTQTLTVRLRQGGVAVSGRAVSFTATGGVLSSLTGTTNAQGLATVDVSSASAGPLTVQASVQGSATTATLPLTVVATTPDKLILQVSPTAIAPNAAGSTTSQARVVAKVTDAVGNPVQGATVNFSRDEDPSGGNLLQASAVTDLNGQASVPYAAGPESTANNGVVLRGTVASAPTVTGTAPLSVNQTALFITLGTGNVIGNIDPETYQKDWVVYVTDANGVAVSGVSLSIKVLPLHYLAGELVANPWAYDLPVRVCRNEDANENGILDPGEDDNGDGVLWPGNVISVSPGTVQTDTTGRATISLIYAESFAPWVNVRLTASATVSGTESRRDAEFIVNGSTSDFTLPNTPAGANSPFGPYRLISAEPDACADYPALP